MLTTVPTTRPQQTAVLLSFVLVSFAANSLVTRYVVANRLLDAYLLTVVRFVAGAVALLVLTLARGDRPRITRANLWPAFSLGVYAVCISFGYEHIGAAAGTFVFYATVLAGLVAYDFATRTPVPRARAVGALVSLAGVGVLTAPAAGDVTLLGVLLLTVTGATWALYTAAGRTGTDPQTATTGNFIVLAVALLVPVGVTVSGGPDDDDYRTGPRGGHGLRDHRTLLCGVVCVPAPDVRDDRGHGAVGDSDPRGGRRPAASR
jgi:hypothetical protein